MAAQTPTALLLIDIQQGFLPTHHPANFWGPDRSNPSFESNTTSLLATYRSLVTKFPTQHKVIHIAHSSLSPTSPLHPSSPGFQFQSFAAPQEGELVLTKNVNSAFIGTELEGILRKHFAGGNGSGKLYLVGLSTDHCVSTTTRMAGNLGVVGGEGEVVLVEDATAAWGKGGWEASVVHAVHAESLREFASVRETAGVFGEWEELGGK